MRYVAAYLLATLGGKDSPSADDVEKILASVGIEAEASSLKKVIAELKGKDISELIAAGQKKLASVPAGGAATSAAPAAAATVAKADAPAEKKKEPEPESESDEDMGFGLFD